METSVPVLIIGAGRSGTNLLSRVLAQDPRFWNAFENRYVWNFHQRTLSHDVRTPDEATLGVKKFIRGFFSDLAEEKRRVIVDKTPSNIFRVAFIHRVFPEAKIIHIIRDGRDNVLSRQYEWYGGRSLVKTNKHVGMREKSKAYRIDFLRQRMTHFANIFRRGNLPLSRLPVFFYDNSFSFLLNLISGEPKRYAERFPGMKEHLNVYGMLATSGAQWREGVMQAVTQGRQLSSESYHELRYENLLGNVEEQWTRLAAFLGIEVDGPCLHYLQKSLRRGNTDKWRTEAEQEQLTILEPHIRATLEFLGYEWESVGE